MISFKGSPAKKTYELHAHTLLQYLLNTGASTKNNHKRICLTNWDPRWRTCITRRGPTNLDCYTFNRRCISLECSFHLVGVTTDLSSYKRNLTVQDSNRPNFLDPRASQKSSSSHTDNLIQRCRAVLWWDLLNSEAYDVYSMPHHSKYAASFSTAATYHDHRRLEVIMKSGHTGKGGLAFLGSHQATGSTFLHSIRQQLIRVTWSCRVRPMDVLQLHLRKLLVALRKALAISDATRLAEWKVNNSTSSLVGAADA